MALLTPWPADAAAAALRAYGLELEAIEPLAGGSVNSNFRLRVREGRTLFARIYEEQGLDGARAEIRLLGELAAAGVPTPAPLVTTSGEPFVLHEAKPVALFPWVEGGIRCQRAVTTADCEKVGAALARVHLATVSQVPAGRFGVGDMQARLDRIEREAPAELAEAARTIREKLASYAARRDASLPEGLVHGDLFRDNVLWAGDEVAALIDFESVCRAPYVYDLAVTAQAWCYGEAFDRDLVAALASGYGAVRPLTNAERAAVPVEAAIGALRFATTRITDYSMRAAPGKPPLRDYRRFLARLDAIEGGGLAQLR